MDPVHGHARTWSVSTRTHGQGRSDTGVEVHYGHVTHTNGRRHRHVSPDTCRHIPGLDSPPSGHTSIQTTRPISPNPSCGGTHYSGRRRPLPSRAGERKTEDLPEVSRTAYPPYRGPRTTGEHGPPLAPVGLPLVDPEATVEVHPSRTGPDCGSGNPTRLFIPEGSGDSVCEGTCPSREGWSHWSPDPEVVGPGGKRDSILPQLLSSK